MFPCSRFNTKQGERDQWASNFHGTLLGFGLQKKWEAAGVGGVDVTDLWMQKHNSWLQSESRHFRRCSLTGWKQYTPHTGHGQEAKQNVPDYKFKKEKSNKNSGIRQIVPSPVVHKAFRMWNWRQTLQTEEWEEVNCRVRERGLSVGVIKHPLPKDLQSSQKHQRKHSGAVHQC